MRIDIDKTPGGGGRDHCRVVFDLGPNDPETVLVRREGKVLGEISLGIVKDGAALWREVLRARRLEALPGMYRGLVHELTRDRCLPDHVNKGPKAQREAFYRGLVDGLQLKTVAHPIPGVPDMLPDYSLSYREGYSCGEAIARTVRNVESLPRAPEEVP